MLRFSWWCHEVNSLAPGKSGCNFENVVFKLALLICIFKSFYDNVARWIPQDLTDNKSTLVQVMAWCHQATSHYLSQCWPRSVSPYGVTRPQWVKTLARKIHWWLEDSLHKRASNAESVSIWLHCIQHFNDESRTQTNLLDGPHPLFLPCLQTVGCLLKIFQREFTMSLWYQTVQISVWSEPGRARLGFIDQTSANDIAKGYLNG